MRIPRIVKELGGAAVLTAIAMTMIAAWHFPFTTDAPLSREDLLRAFYEQNEASRGVTERSERAGDANGARHRIPQRVAEFVATYRLHDAKVLDVGSGTGSLQDVVDDYTGIDRLGSAARFYHKRFVPGTAAAMPFEDNDFDAAWSISALEHASNPEAALAEIRRVVKPGGLLYLSPAWHYASWVADGYEARPYRDLNLGGKLVKASIPLRRSEPFQAMTILPARGVRLAIAALGPSRLHYRRLTPNYQKHRQRDSDAVNSLDPVEVAMWFESRGDTCLNCFSGWRRLWQPDAPLIIRVGQRGKSSATTVRDQREPKPGPFAKRSTYFG